MTEETQLKAMLITSHTNIKEQPNKSSQKHNYCMPSLLCPLCIIDDMCSSVLLLEDYKVNVGTKEAAFFSREAS